MKQPPLNPCVDGQELSPFQAVLQPQVAHHLKPGLVHEIEIAPTSVELQPGLTVPAWGYGIGGDVTSPGPLLEVAAGETVVVRWKNCLPGSALPHQTPPELPFATSIIKPDSAAAQNELGIKNGKKEDTSMSPIGWTTVHLHGAHSSSDSDGWPDNMTPAGGSQFAAYENTYDNMDLGLAKVGEFLWYHDHAMNGTRYHVFAGLAGGYFVRDKAEAQLGLPVSAQDGEILLLIQDRNIDCTDGKAQFVHKTTVGTAEFFGPLTLVNGRLWPCLPLRPEVYRLRLLNGSNARAYRLHLIAVKTERGQEVLTMQQHRLLVIGTDGGLLWKAWQHTDTDSLAMAPAERFDVLLDLTGLEEGTKLYLVNSAQAPFDGNPPFDKLVPPTIETLWRDGDPDGRNPYPWVMHINVDGKAPTPGKPQALYKSIANAELNPAFRRLVHEKWTVKHGPQQLKITGHAHRIILLGEEPAGHLFLQELVEDSQGEIWLQLPGDDRPNSYRVEGWMPMDGDQSSSRVSFYDRVALRPLIRQWQVWQFINTTVDTHPIHIHQSMFQPLDHSAHKLDLSGTSFYNPQIRRTCSPLLLSKDLGRKYEHHETHGWKDVIRIDPGEIVKVAIRFDTPGRYVYHCHVLEHEDTEMMRPIVVTVTSMEDGAPGMGGMGSGM
ncbi:MAG: hypothetical protein JWM11_3939 [Planctomycetaceae bacterium]|nr:hypothetical protein [Planctomycetaceae bacterium]